MNIEFFIECKIGYYKLRAYPFYNKEAWQDWVKVSVNDKDVKVQLLIFMNIPEECLSKTFLTEMFNCNEKGGTYAIVHSTLGKQKDTNQNVVAYGQAYDRSFKVFQDSLLVEWSCKMTAQIF